jgi:dTMP kinase
MTSDPHDSSSPGLFIVFEGIGGSGKSSVRRAVATALSTRGHTIITTRQPGGTPIGAKIRELVLNPAYKADIDANAQLFLYAADRYINIERVIRPALAAGHIVLCDRYDHSTHAYQAASGGNPATLEAINRLATQGLTPHRTYWFNADPQTARDRSRRANRPELDRYDQEELAYWRRVQAAYAGQAHRHPGEIIAIDANEPLETVISHTLADLLHFIGPRRYS